jgi:hypothetical protein
MPQYTPTQHNNKKTQNYLSVSLSLSATCFIIKYMQHSRKGTVLFPYAISLLNVKQKTNIHFANIKSTS